MTNKNIAMIVAVCCMSMSAHAMTQTNDIKSIQKLSDQLKKDLQNTTTQRERGVVLNKIKFIK